MNGFERRANQKKENILQAAQRFIMAHGLRGTTIQMMAKEANVSQVSIYNYFEHKDRVIYEVMKRLLEVFTQRFEAIVYDASRDFDEKTDQLLRLFTQAIEDVHEDVVAYVFNPRKTMMKSLLDWYVDNRIMMGMDHLMREGKKEGVVNQRLSEHAIITLLGLLKAFDYNTHSNDKAAFIGFVQILFYGIKGHKK